MAEFFISIATIWIPIGILFLFFGLQGALKTDPNYITVWGSFGVGIGLGIAGSIALSKAYDRLRKKEVDEQKHFDCLMAELKGFREDMKKR